VVVVVVVVEDGLGLGLEREGGREEEAVRWTARREEERVESSEERMG